jgi:histidyl-tRNA synthetase
VKKPKAVFVNFGEKEALYALKAIQSLRRTGVRAELYPSSAKMKKQMNYADKREIPFVVLAGEEEMNTGIFGVKNMQTGEQQDCTQEELLRLLGSKG